MESGWDVFKQMGQDIFDLLWQAKLCRKDLTIFLAEIESQAIPAEPLAENDIRSDSVRYKIYHGAKNINSLDLRP
jgi:hypothetical protein